MKIMSARLLLGFVLVIGACASSNKSENEVQNAEAKPDVVIQRIDNMNERPGWLKESEPFKIKDGSVTSLGSTEIPGNHRVSAATRIAQNNAKSAIAGAIQQRLEFIFQTAEEGTDFGPTQARYIGAEASKLVTSSIRPGKLYWEKYATSTDSGERVTKYRVFAYVSMPENDFKRAILDAIRNAKGEKGISADFAEKVNSQWDRFVEEK